MMRNIFYAILLLILLGAGVAQAAEWTEDFVKNYDKFGMSVAVENALNDDVSPNAILTFIVRNSKKFETKTGLKALYCAGADWDSVQEAANKLGIIIEDVRVALEESIAECGDKQTLADRDLVDDQPFNNVGLSDRDIAKPDPKQEQGKQYPQYRPLKQYPSFEQSKPRPASPSAP
jgi:hypothetical protein